MQSKKHSLFETLLSTAIGFSVAYLSNLVILPLFGYYITAVDNLWITIFFTVISVIRGYGVRRLFNWLHTSGRL